MGYLKPVFAALLIFGASSPAIAQDAAEMMRRLKEWHRDLPNHPERIKILECMDIKVYEDPQPAGHPPSPAECRRILQALEKKSQQTRPQTRPQKGETYYHSRYLLTGFLLRASYVCDGDYKRMVEVATALVGTNELKMMSKSYPDTTKRWMEEGADNFNAQTMKTGVHDACRFASEARQQAEEIVSAD